MRTAVKDATSAAPRVWTPPGRPPFNLGDWMARVVGLTDSFLADALGARHERIPPRLREAMHYACFNGGKRMRPVLVFAAAQAASGRPAFADSPAVTRVAAAFELIHAHSLVLDDLPCMDDDDLRRGKPTVHRVYGEATALLSADALVLLAYELLADRALRPAVAVRIIRELSAHIGRKGMAAGQMLDLHTRGDAACLESVRRIHLLKTAVLLRACCRAGALAVGASADRVRRLGEFGRHLGLAFQAVDDLLDETATVSETGKRTGKDRVAGKATLPGAVGIEETARIARSHIDAAHPRHGRRGRSAARRGGPGPHPPALRRPSKRESEKARERETTAHQGDVRSRCGHHRDSTLGSTFSLSHFARSGPLRRAKATPTSRRPF